MATAIVITEDLTQTQHTILHQLHKSWETAIETIRQTHCNNENVKIIVGERKLFGNVERQAVRVTYNNEHNQAKMCCDFLLTEMFIYESATVL